MKNVGVKSWYGGICMPRSFCNLCETMAFVIDGKYACCDNPLQIIDGEVSHRISECAPYRIRISNAQRNMIVLSQDNRCLYCLYKFDWMVKNTRTGKKIKLRVEIDHFIPWSHLQTNKGEMIASCQICNRYKSDKTYDSIDSARVAIRNRRAQRGWPNEGMENVIWQHVRQSLQPKLSGNDTVAQNAETKTITE